MSIKDAWQRSVALLRARPVVWLPVLCADLLVYATKLGNGALGRQIILSMIRASQTSVLSQAARGGGRPIESAGEAALLIGATDLATQLATISLYAIAAAVTWSLVRTFVDEPRQELGEAVGSARSKGGRIVGLVLLTFGLVVCLSVVPAILLGGMMPFLHLAREDRMTFVRAANLFALVVAYLAAAWWITPMAVRVMQPEPPAPIEPAAPIAPATLVERAAEIEPAAPIPPPAMTGARLLAAVAATVSLGIGFAGQMVERSLAALSGPDHVAARMVIGGVTSLLAALPFGVLFVFLSILSGAVVAGEAVENN